MDEAPRISTTTVGRTGSFRKRPLASTDSLGNNSPGMESRSSSTEETDDVMEFSSSSPKQTVVSNSVQDEIELHFQRSLSGPKSKRKSLNENESVLSKSSLKGGAQSSSINKERQDSDTRIPPLVKTTVPPLLAVGNNSGEAVAEEDSRTSHSVASPINDRSASASTGSISQQSHSLAERTSLVSSEPITIMPSRIVNPHCINDPRCSSSSYKVGRPAVTQPGSVQVIDLTRDSTLHDKNNIAAGFSNVHSKSLSIVSSSQMSKEGSLAKFAISGDKNGSSSTAVAAKVSTPVNNQVIFLPAAPGIGSAVMMQPQPFILMNPTEMPRISPPPLIAAHNVHTGGGGNYILVSPSQTAPNSLFQVMPSSGVAVSPSSKIGAGVTTLAGLQASQQIMLVGTPPAHPAKSADTTKLVTEGDRKDDINVMPASVEDHFAKALGDQWPKLNSDNVSPSSNVVKS